MTITPHDNRTPLAWPHNRITSPIPMTISTTETPAGRRLSDPHPQFPAASRTPPAALATNIWSPSTARTRPGAVGTCVPPDG